MSDRWKTMVLSVAGVAVVFSINTGVGGGIPLVLGAALVVFVVASRSAPSGVHRRSEERVWAAAGPFVFTPATTAAPSSVGAIVRSLARAEGRQLFPGSAAFGVGVGFCVVVIVFLGFVWTEDHNGELAEAVSIAPFVVHPLVGMTIVAVHRARTRARRDETAELFDSCPVSATARDRGHLWTAMVPAAVAAITVGVVTIALALQTDSLWGPFGAEQVANLLGAPVLAVGGTALGVLLARWAPWQLVPVAAVVAVAMVSLRLQDVRGGDADGAAQLSTLGAAEDVEARFTAVRWVEHHLWIVGLVLVVLLLAGLGERGARRARVAVLAVAAVATAGAGLAATRDIDNDDARHIASLIIEPERHQTCADVGSGEHTIPVCVYRGDDELVANTSSHLEPVLAAVPAMARLDAITFRQGSDVHVRLENLDNEVRRLVTGHDLAADVVPVRLADEARSHEAARFWAALAAIGVAEPARAGAIIDLSGQSRGVVAIWLATRGLPVERAIERMASVDTNTPDNHDFDPGRPWPGVCEGGATPVVWALSDLEAARQLIRTDDATVRALVADRWAEWVDPSTTTAELLEALSLAPVEPSSRTTRASSTC